MWAPLLYSLVHLILIARRDDDRLFTGLAPHFTTPVKFAVAFLLLKENLSSEITSTAQLIAVIRSTGVLTATSAIGANAAESRVMMAVCRRPRCEYQLLLFRHWEVADASIICRGSRSVVPPSQVNRGQPIEGRLRNQTSTDVVDKNGVLKVVAKLVADRTKIWQGSPASAHFTGTAYTVTFTFDVHFVHNGLEYKKKILLWDHHLYCLNVKNIFSEVMQVFETT